MAKRTRAVITYKHYTPPAKRQRVVLKPIVNRAVLRPSLVPLARRGWSPNSIEKKVADVLQTNRPADTTGSISLLAIPVLGSDMNQRIGRKIHMRSLYIRGTLQRESYAAGNHPACLCRLIVVYDKQPNGAAPIMTDILNAADSVAHLNLNNRDRFQIIKDKQWSLDAWSLNETVGQFMGLSGRCAYPVKIYKKLNLETIYNASAGSIADITSGALWLVTIGNTADGGNFSLTSRVRYDDV